VFWILARCSAIPSFVELLDRIVKKKYWKKQERGLDGHVNASE
jgi:hypothetical protein